MRRQHHLATVSEIAIGAAIDNLQQPLSHASIGKLSHLEALRQLHDLTKLPGSGASSRSGSPSPLSLEVNQESPHFCSPPQASHVLLPIDVIRTALC